MPKCCRAPVGRRPPAGPRGRGGRGRPRDRRATLPTLREQFLRTNVDVFLLGILAAAYNWDSGALASESDLFGEDELQTVESYDSEGEGRREVDDPVYAVLFPFFTQGLAIFIYYAITRYLKVLPYTACVFLMGTIIGYATNNRHENAIAYSTSIWLGINGQVILLVFLPGLIFHDSFTINVHLFFQAFWQLIIFAFPMVLGGASLTALVAYFVLPYGWSPSLCMTFGAILSGTDPIAVAGLLNSSGAPERLKMHISGESLLNDGSVVVLYNIFSALFFSELGIPGGEQFTVGEGFAYFFRLALGGSGIGFGFGLGTVIMLKFLNRRLSDEENVVQVVLTVSSAYLAYFCSEILAGCSGIMATIACGITVKVLGETFINNRGLTLHFWQVTAELLNTLLFVLGGCLWGNILSTDSFSRSAEGWGYLALLFVILIAIRFVLVFGLYPITARIGIGTSWKESIFMSYGGFRGSVGIALALSLDVTTHNHSTDEGSRDDTDKVFCLVGGISVLTLLINGMTSGPLLSALGLAATEKSRKRVVDNYKQQMVQSSLQDYVRLLSQERWKGIDHSIVRQHVPLLDCFSFDELMVAVERHKNNTPVHLYAKPRLEHVFPYLKGEQIVGDCSILSNLRSQSFETLFKSKSYEKLLALERGSPGRPTRSPSQTKERIEMANAMWNDVFDLQSDDEDDSATEKYEDIDEVRLNYIEILRSSYYHQIENGSLEEHGDLTYSLFEGLSFCEDRGKKGHPLNDWEATKVASETRVVLANRMFLMLLRRFRQLWRRETKLCAGLELFSPERFKVRFLVRQNLAFVRAHRHARTVFESHFASDPLTPAEKQIIEESQAQIRLAEADLAELDTVDVTAVKAHLLCLVLLNNSVKYVERLSRQHLIPEQNASELLEVLDQYVEDVWTCDKHVHDGRLSTSTQIVRLKQLPRNIMDEFNIWESIDEMSRNSMSPPMQSLTEDRDMKRERSQSSPEIPKNTSTGVLTVPTLEGSDTPMEVSSSPSNGTDGSNSPLSPPNLADGQSERRVLFSDEEAHMPGPSGLRRSETDGSDTPLTF